MHPFFLVRLKVRIKFKARPMARPACYHGPAGGPGPLVLQMPFRARRPVGTGHGPGRTGTGPGDERVASRSDGARLTRPFAPSPSLPLLFEVMCRGAGAIPKPSGVVGHGVRLPSAPPPPPALSLTPRPRGLSPLPLRAQHATAPLGGETRQTPVPQFARGVDSGAHRCPLRRPPPPAPPPQSDAMCRVYLRLT